MLVILIFVNGPFTGTTVQTSARSALVTKSPLTNGFLDTHVGGHFGPALKRTGYDYVLIKGKSSKPVYLHITDAGCEILDAENLWGKGIFDTEKSLKQKHPLNSSFSENLFKRQENEVSRMPV